MEEISLSNITLCQLHFWYKRYWLQHHCSWTRFCDNTDLLTDDCTCEKGWSYQL